MYLNSAHGTTPASPTLPSQLNRDMDMMVVLNKWQGLPITEATWEDYQNIYTYIHPSTLRTG